MRFLWIGAALLVAPATACWADAPSEDAAVEVPAGPLPEPSQPGWTQWFNPATAPFIPVPLISTDPNSGTTIGLIPTWVHTNENHNVSRIIAPDVTYNPYFGFGVDGRIFAYSSDDKQWSLVAGVTERVQREFDAEYQIGRLREQLWSISYSLIYNRDGTPRFYGIGNDTPASNETSYVSNQEFAEVQIGLNLTHAWQLLYTLHFKEIDVLPGALNDVASIETKFPQALGTNHEFLNRLSIVHDTRDDPSIPTRGGKWLLYVGAAANDGLINNSSYSELGIDGRQFWPIGQQTVLAAHVALRYMPTVHDAPFWALSNIGGGQSIIGGEQPLRGFGFGRFYDQDGFSTTLEVRRKLFTFDAVTTNLDVEIAPFVDLGHVFARTSTNPVQQLHQVYGVGFRGIARPFVVGYVDIGYGSEGAAVFTGLNYPF